MQKIYIDGQFVDAAEAKISVFDHGLLYGDGIFEGIRLYQGNVFRLEAHLKRLEDSAKAIMLTIPLSRAEMREAVCEACRINQLQDGYIRLIVTRGVGNLGLSPVGCKPSVIIIAGKIQLYPPETYTVGLKIITVATRRVNPAALPPMVKSLNYLNNIMAKMEAQQLGYLEAIMLNDAGFVAECTGDNLFLFRGDELVTPAVNAGNLRGITRQAVIDLAHEKGYRVVEQDLSRYDVWTADECFLTGTAAEIIPVVEVDGREIGNGSVGKKSLELLNAFHKITSTDGTRIH